MAAASVHIQKIVKLVQRKLELLLSYLCSQIRKTRYQFTKALRQNPKTYMQQFWTSGTKIFYQKAEQPDISVFSFFLSFPFFLSFFLLFSSCLFTMQLLFVCMYITMYYGHVLILYTSENKMLFLFLFFYNKNETSEKQIYCQGDFRRGYCILVNILCVCFA